MLLRALVAITLSSLAGVLVWLALLVRQMLTFGSVSFDSSWLTIFGVAWLYAVVLTIVIGVPVGLLASFVLRRLAVEQWWTYIAVGALAASLFAFLLPSRAEFWIPTATTGGVLGAFYWWLLRKPQIA